MHAGFAALAARHVDEHPPPPRQPRRNGPSDTRADIEQLDDDLGQALNRFGGPFLFGKRSIADAMFAPVATRLRTYAVEISPQAQSYCDTIFADAAFRDWERAAAAETWTIEQTEALYR